MRKLSLLVALAMLTMLALAPAAFAQADRDCMDFASQAEAQNYFDANGGSPSNNFDNLDANNNGMACEDYDYGGGTTQPPTTTVGTTVALPMETTTVTAPTVTTAPTATAVTTPAATTTTGAPAATSTSGALPDTGGPTGGPVLLLPAAALLLGAGLVVLRLSRRNS